MWINLKSILYGTESRSLVNKEWPGITRHSHEYDQFSLINHSIFVFFLTIQWPRGLRSGSAAACLLGVGSKPAGYMDACECCVLSGRGHYDEPTACPEKSYRMWCVVVCDLETYKMRRQCPVLGCSTARKERFCLITWVKYPVPWQPYKNDNYLYTTTWKVKSNEAQHRTRHEGPLMATWGWVFKATLWPFYFRAGDRVFIVQEAVHTNQSYFNDSPFHPHNVYLYF
jgi:hypothetical protein